MRISSKGRYAVAALIFMAQKQEEQMNISHIAQELGISKIYLEQVFSQLKRSNIITSVKGAQGGYNLAKNSRNITIHEILHSIEGSIFENTDKSVSEQAPEIDQAMATFIWDKLDSAINSILNSITLSDIADKATNLKDRENMFYI